MMEYVVLHMQRGKNQYRECVFIFASNSSVSCSLPVIFEGSVCVSVCVYQYVRLYSQYSLGACC